MTIEQAIKSGKYSQRELEKMFPDMRPYHIRMACELYGLRRARTIHQRAVFEECRKTITAMFNDGMSDQQIADAMGKQRYFITNAREYFGLMRDRQPEYEKRVKAIYEMWQAGKSDEEIGKAMDMTTIAVSAFRRRQGWTSTGKLNPKRVALLKPWFDQGLNDVEIYKATGINRSTIRKYRAGMTSADLSVN